MASHMVVWVYNTDRKIKAPKKHKRQSIKWLNQIAMIVITGARNGLEWVSVLRIKRWQDS